MTATVQVWEDIKMTNEFHEAPPVDEPELDESILGAHADRLEQDLNEAVSALPAYQEARKAAGEKAQTIEFKMGDWECEYSCRGHREGGWILATDFTRTKTVDGEKISESYAVDTIAPLGRRAAFLRQGVRTGIVAVVGNDSQPNTQTAVDRFDSLITELKFAA